MQSWTGLGAAAAPAVANSPFITPVLRLSPCSALLQQMMPHIPSWARLHVYTNLNDPKLMLRVRPKPLESKTSEVLISLRTVCMSVCKACDIYFSP